MKSRHFFKFRLTLFLFVLSRTSLVAADDHGMNVVFILADDLGWADTTLYGHTSLYETPNLERLAKKGMTFTRAYSNSPLCSPTRASILTGQNPTRHGSFRATHHKAKVVLQPTASDQGPPGRKTGDMETVSRLDTRLPTLGKLIQAAGYRTGHFGKWHLGNKPYTPLQHGFGIHIPLNTGPGPSRGFIAPWKYPNLKPTGPKEHIEDRVAAEAVSWMQGLDDSQPFFLNYWQFSVHAPFDAKEELIATYRKKIDKDDAQNSAIYAAMVHSLDDAVGTILDAIEAQGMERNTVIIFISDNGGNAYSNLKESDASGKKYKTYPTSNAPLRGGKATLWEGGIRVPCVVVWPGVTRPGTTSDAIIQTSDFYTTLLTRLGIGMPENHPVDGIDITPALKGGSLAREAIFTYFPHEVEVPDALPKAITVHSGDWKLFRVFHNGDTFAHEYKLYHLADDIGERNNLAAAYPERVQAMDQLIEAHLNGAHAVVPLPNKNFDPTTATGK